MIDPEKIINRIEIIKENVHELEDLRALTEQELISNRRNLAAAKHFIRISIEAMIDIASHIVAKKLIGIPPTATDTMIFLAKHKIIPEQNIQVYVKMVKYRNRLVHFYHELTEKEIYQIIQNNLPDFGRFISDISSYMNSLNEQ